VRGGRVRVRVRVLACCVRVRFRALHIGLLGVRVGVRV